MNQLLKNLQVHTRCDVLTTMETYRPQNLNTNVTFDEESDVVVIKQSILASRPSCLEKHNL